jgi:CBS domain-containing protein
MAVETIMRENSPATPRMGRFLGKFRRLTISSIMSPAVVTAKTDETVLSVAKKMVYKGVSCVVVAEEKRVRGIFTERDLVRWTAYAASDSDNVTMSQQMSSPVETIALGALVLDVAEMMEAKGIKRLPVVAHDKLIGMVTQTDITRGLVLLSPLRSISRIISGDLATVDASQAVAEAAQIMSERHISSVVILRNGSPVGILTEEDVTRRVVAARRDPVKTLVVQVMSSPLHWVPTTCSVLSANQKMSALGVRRLVVMDNGQAQGVVSQTDIMRSVRAELERVDADRMAAGSAITESVQHIRGEVVELNEFLRRRLSELDGHDPDGADEITGRINHIANELERLQLLPDSGVRQQTADQPSAHPGATADKISGIMG